MRRLVVLPWLVLAGCGVDVDEKTLAEAEGVRLVDAHRHGKELACAGGHGFGFCWPKDVDGHTVRLEFDDRTVRVSCPPSTDDGSLRWDDAHTRLAVHCDARWSIVYLPTAGYAGVIDAPAGFDGEDWSAAPTFASAARDLWGPKGSTPLVRAIAEGEGLEAAADFLVARCFEPSEVRWKFILEDLDPQLVAATHGRVRDRLLAGDTPPQGDCIGRTSTSPPPVFTPTEQERARAILRSAETPGWLQRWLLWELRRTPIGPEAACAWVGRQPPGSWTEPDGHATTVAMLAILDGDEPCPALVDFVEPPCHPQLVDIGSDGAPEPFDPETHAMVLETMRKKMRLYPAYMGPVVFTVVREALRERTDAPHVRARMDRLSYATDALEDGCKPISALVAACEQPPGATAGEAEGCRFSIDDEARTLGPSAPPP